MINPYLKQLRDCDPQCRDDIKEADIGNDPDLVFLLPYLFFAQAFEIIRQDPLPDPFAPLAAYPDKLHRIIGFILSYIQPLKVEDRTSDA